MSARTTSSPVIETASPRQSVSLVQNVGWATAGNVVHGGARWLTVIVLAKLGGAGMVGTFVLGVALVEPLIMFSQLQLRAVLVTDAKRETAFGTYVLLRVSMALITVVVATFLGIAAGYAWPTITAIVGVAIWRAIEAISDILHGRFQRDERMDQVAASLALRSTAGLLAMSLGVYWYGDLVVGLAGLALTALFVLLGWDLPRSLDAKELPRLCKVRAMYGNHVRTILSLARFAMPLGLAMMFVAMSQSAPRVVIEAYLGTSELGIFAALAHVSVAGMMIAMALGGAASPRLAQFAAIGDWSSFDKLVRKMVASASVIGGAGIAFAALLGDRFIDGIYGATFVPHTDLFIWVMAAGGISYVASVLGFAVTATRQFHRLTLPYLMLSLFSAGASLVLIPVHGLVGAAWALMLVGVVSCLIPLVILRSCRRDDE